MSDKIAEHIAKFNAPEGSEFYWVSNSGEEFCYEFENRCLLDYLRLKKSNGVYQDLLGLATCWTYAIKHEPEQEKGEIMKSIELSDWEISAIRVAMIDRISLLEFRGARDAMIKVVEKINNAGNGKPIEPIEKWSEKEIRGELEKDEWGPTAIDRIIKILKTPKPVMRDMDKQQRIDWWLAQENPTEMRFVNINHTKIWGNPLDESVTFYKTEAGDTWLPIPQIEKEK